MNIQIEKKYLIFPTHSLAKKKRVRFLDGENEVYALNMRLDQIDPDFFAYVDVRRFIGKKLWVEISPDTAITLAQSDEMEGEYNDRLRPYIHFSTKRGWINDPNGLVKLGDTYHLFYQHNPAERNWDNMHWGHAISKDLFHWKELPTSLFPDATGTMYSGSAVIDCKNLSGLGKDGQSPVLLYYTAAGRHASIPVSSTQCLAYSTDGLRTIEKYGENPVVQNITEGNRDPKVVWCEELKSYVMSLFMQGDEFALFTSKDLLSWAELQRVIVPNEYECPNFFPLTATDGKRKWVFTGARDVYLIGNFQKGKFQATQEAKRMNGATAWYAAQAYTDMSDGRTIRIPWLRTCQAKTFSQQMGTPCELRLENFDGEYYLSFQPVKEISSIVSNRKTYKNVFLTKPKKMNLEDCAVSLKLQGEWKKEGIVKLIFLGVEILFNFAKNEIVVGDAVNALSLQQKNLDVQILADRSAMEFYCDGGKIAFALSHQAVCDANLPYVEISSDCDYRLEDLTIEEYERTWEQNQ